MLSLDPQDLEGLRQALNARGMNAETAVSPEALRESLAGRYRVVGELGRGAMGVVFLAHEQALERPVALKVLPPFLAVQRQKREHFLREARTAAGLSHPNIVPIYAVEEIDDWVFFTMDYVDGENLRQRVESRGPLPVGEATRILYDVACAVGYAHARGVVHRDLKPDNIMIERGSGRVMVMDFGIAGVEGKPDVIREGYIAGTAPFVSPEQLRGGKGDERSDVYALGVTAYFAVTGRLPFDGDTVDDIFTQHLMKPAPPLTVYGQHLDLTFSNAARRCLEKDPARRFQTADFLADELAHTPELRQRDLPVPLEAFAQRLRRYSESSRGLSALVGVAVMFLILGLWTGDWEAFTLAAGFLGLVVASTAIALLPPLRRALRADKTHADIVHALSLDLARDRELRAFELGSISPRPAAIARRVAYGGLGVVGLAAASSLVGMLDPMTGFRAMWAGVLIAVAAGFVGFLYTRRRRNLAGEWWLRFWRSRAGGWVTRLAALGLGRTRLPAEGQDDA